MILVFFSGSKKHPTIHHLRPENRSKSSLFNRSPSLVVPGSIWSIIKFSVNICHTYITFISSPCLSFVQQMLLNTPFLPESENMVKFSLFCTTEFTTSGASNFCKMCCRANKAPGGALGRGWNCKQLAYCPPAIWFHIVVKTFISWMWPPPSNSGKWRFIGIPYWNCNNPGGHCYWEGATCN